MAFHWHTTTWRLNCVDEFLMFERNISPLSSIFMSNYNTYVHKLIKILKMRIKINYLSISRLQFHFFGSLWKNKKFFYVIIKIFAYTKFSSSFHHKWATKKNITCLSGIGLSLTDSPSSFLSGILPLPILSFLASSSSGPSGFCPRWYLPLLGSVSLSVACSGCLASWMTAFSLSVCCR